MLSRAFISREEIDIGCKLLGWAENYLMGNEEKIMRPYGPRTVCPFAEASVRKNALYMVFHSELAGEDIEPILSLLVDYINPFIVQDSTKEKSHKALLAVFPRIGPEHYGSLDRVHELIKECAALSDRRQSAPTARRQRRVSGSHGPSGQVAWLPD
jgi:hypothetical protein